MPESSDPRNISLVAGLQIPPATGTPSSTMATETQNSGMPATSSRVPSSGSTTQTWLFSRRLKSSTLSSESQPSPSRRSSLRRTASTERSASVTGSCPILYSVSIAPGVNRLSTARAASRADWMRCSVSAWECLVMNLKCLCSSPEHPRPGYQQNGAENAPQPQRRHPRAQVRTDKAAGYRADDERTYQIGI